MPPSSPNASVSPAYVGNDVNIAALAVLHFRNAKTQNLMVITIEHGVGAGLIVGGELVEGEQFAAGEIGHVTVDEDGDPCICGHRGCLEPLIDAAELRKRLVEAATRPNTTTYSRTRAGHWAPYSPRSAACSTSTRSR